MATTFLENEYKLDGAVVVVTGGASGIGLATIRAFQGVGAMVSVLDREAPSSAGANTFHSVDVADPVAFYEVIDAVRSRHSRLDVLVNCAGMAIRQPASDVPLKDWNRVVAVNMTGTFLCAREAHAQ